MNLKQGQTVHLTSGTFKGYSGTILEIYTYNVNVEIEIFGWRTVVSVSLYELGIISKPPSMASLIEEFEQLYQQNAPLRYALLNDGITRQNIQSLDEELHVSHLPNAYIDLYTWKNGLPSRGWKNEFEEDSWYELLPLDRTNHFVALHKAVDVVSLWENIALEATNKKEPCYWKQGFIPLLEAQNYGLVVIDTVGYFHGKPDQLVFFDYKCANGYRIIHESLETWMSTNIALLKENLFFAENHLDRIQVIKKACDPFANQFIGQNFPLTLNSIWDDLVQSMKISGASDEAISHENEKRLLASNLYDCALAVYDFDRPEILEELIQTKNIDINAPTPRSHQPLLFLAIVRNRTQSCRILIEAGADIYHQQEGKGYLFWAVYTNANPELVDYLLHIQKGPIEQVTDELISIAKRKSSPKVIALLESYGKVR